MLLVLVLVLSGLLDLVSSPLMAWDPPPVVPVEEKEKGAVDMME